MLDAADVIVVNKSDLAGARTAASEITHRLEANHRGQKLIATVAKQHRDAGIDELLATILPPSREPTPVRLATSRRMARTP